MNEKNENDERIGSFGNFVVKLMDGRVNVYWGSLIGVSPTHLTIRMRDGKECSLLRSDIFKIEWGADK